MTLRSNRRQGLSTLVVAASGLLAVSQVEAQQQGAAPRPHQPGESAFVAVLPEDIEWRPFPAFPPSVRLAVIVGKPGGVGPYAIRVKVPSGVKLAPHRHPEDRVYTVISGVFYIGLGDRFDESRLQAYPPGSVIVLPGGTLHFHWARSGEYVSQVNAIGPLGLDYVDPQDDPRLTKE
jgi:quercetin dioxygenase-like cupin family protein